MRSFYVAALVAAALAGGCSRQGTEQAENAPGPAGTPFEDFVIRPAVTHGNLTIFPIVSITPRMADRFITLDEGLAAGTVKILEVGAAAAEPNAQGDGPDPTPVPNDDPFDDSSAQTAEPDGDVNRLMVLNTSGRPLYLMPGEVISGGRQDRTIGDELVIASGDKPVPIDVFCVEHARWSSRTLEETRLLVEALAANSRGAEGDNYDTPGAVNVNMLLPQAATKGEFVAPAGQAGKDLRLAIQKSQDQGKVWDEISELNAKVGTETATGTFAAAHASPDVGKRLEPYLERLRSLGDTEQIVGVAVCVGGEMRSADVFESTPLFRKFWPKLLRSYALDALADDSADQEARPCTVERCLAFLKETSQADAQTETAEHGDHVRRESERAISFSYYDRRSEPGEAALGGMGAGMMGGMGGGMGGAVHSGAFSK